MPNDAILFKIAPKWFSRGEMGGTKWFWSSALAVSPDNVSKPSARSTPF